MTGIFSQQLGVVKNFQKCLEHMNGDPKTRSKPHHFTKALQHFSDWAKEQSSSSQLKKEKSISLAEMEFLEDLVEEVENRKSEIMDLESAALQTCRQVSELENTECLPETLTEDLSFKIYYHSSNSRQA